MDLKLFSKQQDIRYVIQLLGELNSFLEKAKNDPRLMELDCNFIVRFLLRIKDARKTLSLEDSFKEISKDFDISPEEAEKKYVEIKDFLW